ncbi:ABC transporter permease [Deinococcus cellulosilyticus]|uniref:Sugar ABC transporter permease n=1 Tax=Deinococcus cellulosilyticus (strain DSM 18568 / NBRC 106333 / KACC 11606 / 5516J-15) TaxID=1223518 RepID=A0A511MVD7_DEIC1|nr:ABC transporter permease [Deinococcus cellulosilyticus]GEM44543.1 sugar ABC transporter permease [Deinococcus cellulosilyticus NBRC 106333 = KACC 11606]
MLGSNTMKPKNNGPERKFSWQTFLQQYSGIITLLVLFVFNAIFTPHFLSMQTLNINLTQVATIVIVGVGMTLVIATGGIDLSVGSLMAIAGALAPMIFMSEGLKDSPYGIALAFVLPVLAVTLLGLFNGLLVSKFQLQPIIATLVLFIAGRGIAQVLTGGNLQTFTNPAFQYIGMGKPFGIPFQVILMVLIVVLAAWMLRKTVLGRHILSVGGNEKAARLSGVPIQGIKYAVYAISGLLAGIAGLITIAINSASDANQVGQNMELDAIAAVAVGGTLLEGGKATIVGTLIGALIIQLIRYTLLAKGVPDSVALIVKAGIIVGAVALQRSRRA